MCILTLILLMVSVLAVAWASPGLSRVVPADFRRRLGTGHRAQAQAQGQVQGTGHRAQGQGTGSGHKAQGIGVTWISTFGNSRPWCYCGSSTIKWPLWRRKH